MSKMYKQIILKTPEEISIIRENGKIIANLFNVFREKIKPGISTLELDKLADSFIQDNGASASFKGYGGFPNSICTSLNTMVIHGIPSTRDLLKNGDILGIDIGVYKNGFHADSAFTFQIGEVSEDAIRLCKVTKDALAMGITQARVGKTLFDVCNAIGTHIQKFNMGNIREFVGHGVGRELHEAPQVPNYAQPGLSQIKLKEGMVFAIEPMVSLGSGEIYIADDQWSVFTSDYSLAAHFEHTIAITENGPLILTDI